MTENNNHTPDPRDGWTPETLFTHFSKEIRSFKDATTAAQHAASRAVELASIALEKRLDSLNEFRAMLNDTQQMTMPRKEYTVQHEELRTRLDDLAMRVSKNENNLQGRKEGLSQLGALILGIIALAGLLISILNVITTSHHPV